MRRTLIFSLIAILFCLLFRFRTQALYIECSDRFVRVGKLGRFRFNTAPRVPFLSREKRRISPGFRSRGTCRGRRSMPSPDFRTYSVKIPSAGLGYPGEQPLTSTHIMPHYYTRFWIKLQYFAKNFRDENARIFRCVFVKFAQRSFIPPPFLPEADAYI